MALATFASEAPIREATAARLAAEKFVATVAESLQQLGAHDGLVMDLETQVAMMPANPRSLPPIETTTMLTRSWRRSTPG